MGGTLANLPQAHRPKSAVDHGLEWFLDQSRASEDASALVEYQDDPEGFLCDVLGLQPWMLAWSELPGYEEHGWDGTPDPLLAVCHALRDGSDVGVESGTGTGKTFLVACLVLWFLASWEGATVVTAATKGDQLDRGIWAEIGELWPRFQSRFPDAKLLTRELRMRGGSAARRGKWYAQGITSRVGSGESLAATAKGFHSPHMLIIYEEAQGIKAEIVKALDRTCTSEHNLQVAIGNPSHQLDPLHQFCERATVTAVRISSLDHPNVVLGEEVIPGAVTKAQLDGWREDGLDEADREWLTQVRGLSPAESSDALVKLKWLREAAERFEDEAARERLRGEGLRALGVDVANSSSGDHAAIAFGEGAVLEWVKAYVVRDANRFGRVRVLRWMKDLGIPGSLVGVDAVGVGAGAVNELKRLGRAVRALESAGSVVKTDDSHDFLNLRAQMWWQLRVDLMKGNLALARDDQLWHELTVVEWEEQGGKIKVESKKELRKKLDGRSPDRADAVVYWNWVRQRLGLATEGGAGGVTF